MFSINLRTTSAEDTLVKKCKLKKVTSRGKTLPASSGVGG